MLHRSPRDGLSRYVCLDPICDVLFVSACEGDFVSSRRRSMAGFDETPAPDTLLEAQNGLGRLPARPRPRSRLWALWTVMGDDRTVRAGMKNAGMHWIVPGHLAAATSVRSSGNGSHWTSPDHDESRAGLERRPSEPDR
jgi:hypothetical protein